MSTTATDLRGVLVDLGVPIDEIDATPDPLLGVLALEHLAGTGAGRYDEEEVAALAGVPVEVARQLWRALGFPDPDPLAPTFTDADVDALRTAALAIDDGEITLAEVLQVTRVMASSMARVAETQLEVATSPSRIAGGRQPDAASFLDTPKLLEFMWRRQVQAAARRARLRSSPGEPLSAPVVVGFADLVGFTALSQQLSGAELGELVERFTTLAFDSVAAAGGRVVKTIGDEVMFVVDDVDGGVDLALTLVDTYAGEQSLSDVRVGVAAGGVLMRDGDLYGPVVNLASRIVALARPASVVVGPEVHEQLADDPAYLWRGLRPRSLKGIGRVRLWAVRRAE